MIQFSALQKHYERSAHEVPILIGLLTIGGVALGVTIGSLWPIAWAIASSALICCDIAVMKATLAKTKSSATKISEWPMIACGLLLVCTFVSMPTYLLMTFEFNLVIGAMAFFSAGATRSATIFAVSRRVGIAYFTPYFIIPCVALGLDVVAKGGSNLADNATSALGIVCCLGYIWKAWLTRHAIEIALDKALAETEAQRDKAARDASVSTLLFQQTSLRAALFDHEGRFIAVNNSWLSAIQQTETDVIGKTLMEAMPDSQSHWPSAITNALKGETTRVTADHRIRKDGAAVFLDWEVQPWYNGDGSLGGAVAYAQDVTEMYAARASAQSKQERLELALKANKSFIWEVDYTEQSVTFDDEAIAFFGKEPTFAMMSKRDASVVHPDDQETQKRQVMRVLQNGGFGRMESRHIMPDGSMKWVRSDLAPSGFTNGVPSRFVMLTSDISCEMARHERLATMMARANDALGEKRKLLEELCGETSTITVAPKPIIPPTVSLAATETAESTFTHLFAGFDQILTEIDERDVALAAAVQQLRDARATAEAANVAKSQFMANMSHELRTPLNAIIGYTEILIEDAEYEERTDAAKDATKVRTSATHLLSLINEILDLSKIEAGRMDISREPTPLTDIITDLVLSNETLAAEHGNRVVVEIDCERTLALTDGFRLRQCLLNLLSNACKFTDQGTITIGLQTTQVDDDNRWFEISVKDTGIGISEEQMSRLFRPFSQADSSTTRKYGGTGLGLALTREMMHLLGGDVTVSSIVGEGSTFTIRIPALGLEAADVATVQGSSANSALVLIVDDDPLARALASRSATALGLSVATAETGRAALEYCEENNVDLVVLDIQLPDMDGYEVLMALRGGKETRDIPVMVVSVNDDRRQSISNGAQEHLSKPCPSAVLTAAMARLARRNGPNHQHAHEIEISEPNPISINEAQDTIVLDRKTLRSA